MRPRLLALLLVLGPLVGCGHDGDQAGDKKLPLVKVSAAIVRPVIDYMYFTGRTDAVESVEVRARASGYLDKILFESGKEVEKDKLLFEIDPRTYKAALAQAEGQVALYESRLRRLNRDYIRNQPLVRTGAISPQDFDKIVGDKDEADGSLRAAKASAASNELNLAFCKVYAPVSGKVGRNLLTLGNLITEDKTLLTTIVSQDPMYAYFDVDERTMLNVKDLIRKGTISRDFSVEIGLANEGNAFPHKGKVDFVNNQVDTGTGTLQVRGSFPNPKIEPSGERVLTPGLFVRVRVPLGDKHEAILISERAIGTDQGLKFIYVIANNRVERRSVTLGALHDGLREIKGGLEKGELVVVAGLQRLVPGAEVRTEPVPMPEPPAAKP